MNRTLIGIDPAAIPNPATGQLYYDRTVCKLLIYDGAMWFPVGNEIFYCVLCKVADWAHNKEVQHPFLFNNLELLEWRYEQSIR